MFLCKCIILIALVVMAPLSTNAGTNIWSGSGPFDSGLGNQTFSALAVSDDGHTVYAGNGNGTVFSYDYGYLLSIGISGSGKGLVTGDTGEINCSNNGGNVCSTTYRHGTVVNLTAATLTARSTFDSWLTDCSGVGGCYAVMTKNRSVGAAFGQGGDRLGPVARIQDTGTGYLSAFDAYQAAGRDQVVMTVLGPHPALGGILNEVKTVTLKGGYATDQDYNFTTQSGYSDITGPLKINAGKLIVNNVKVIKAP